MGGEKRAQVFSIFDGFPAKLIAQWCAVSLPTARAYKAGRRKPSRQALRLFTLHRERRVLGEPWRGWLVTDLEIVNPDGEAVTRGQFRAYVLVMQIAADLAKREGPEAQERFYRALGIAG